MITDLKEMGELCRYLGKGISGRRNGIYERLKVTTYWRVEGTKNECQREKEKSCGS